MSLPYFQQGVKLADHTTFRIGGPAAAFYIARTPQEVLEAASKADGKGLPWQVIGHGSNILAADSGYNGAIISFRDLTPPRLTEELRVTVSGGLPLSQLVRFYGDNGLAGVEDLAGIPGTVGGAIAGNAGAYGMAIGGLVESALLMDRNGDMRRCPGSELIFSYRTSSIRAAGEVLLEATMSATRDEPASVKARIEARLAERWQKHPDPSQIGTAGSYFKNPASDEGGRMAAGRLIEQAGCSGLKVGGAMLWQKHANIIVTEGRAMAGHVLELADRMAEKVRKTSGVNLIPEVVYLG